MSSLTESEKLGGADFRWGEKGGVGGKNKKVQFYRSFTYDGVDYALHDCVYMYMEGEPAPYIGKVVKLWENADKSKRVKVQWFFRPSEISYYLKDIEVLENELFFASGEGTGLVNLNPLEAIAGKCNVVCISTDSRNPQPSAEERKMADYVFYRVFDVKSFIISDQLEDKVGGLEVKYVFNNTLDRPKLDSNDKNDERNVVACKETLKPAGENSIQQLNNGILDKNSDHSLEGDTNKMLVPLEQGSLHANHSSSVDVISSEDDVTTGTAIEGRSILDAENVGCDASGGIDEFKDMRSPVSKVQVEEAVKHTRKSCNLDNTPPSSAKSDCPIPGNDAADLATGSATSVKAKLKPELVKDSVGSGKDVKLAENSSLLDGKLSNMKSSLPKDAPRSGHVEDAVGIQKKSKSNRDVNALQGKLSESNSFPSIEKSESEHAKDSAHTEKNKKLGGNLGASKGKTLGSNVASRDETLRPTNVPPNETPKSGSNKDIKGSQQAAKLTQSKTSSTKKGLKRSADLSEEKSSSWHECSHENNDKNLASNTCPIEKRSLKKVKLDDTIKPSEDKDTNNKKLKDCVGEGTLKEHRNEKDDKFSSDNLPNPLTSRPKGGVEVGGQVIEVTRRPIEKTTWIKFPWEERMKTAHGEGRLVMFHNLDPKYTSGEVEDIIYHVFKEKCTAKMMQQTAISSPFSGQALVAFGTKEAANKVLQKLDDGCLMLPNQRPLVGCLGILPMLERQTTFVGHLAVDKARRPIQREIKEAVATSHYSQSNTLEFDMAMEWCLLQSQSDEWWKKLYEIHKEEMRKLRGDLKPNSNPKKSELTKQ